MCHRWRRLTLHDEETAKVIIGFVGTGDGLGVSSGATFMELTYNVQQDMSLY